MEASETDKYLLKSSASEIVKVRVGDNIDIFSIISVIKTKASGSDQINVNVIQMCIRCLLPCYPW